MPPASPTSEPTAPPPTEPATTPPPAEPTPLATDPETGASRIEFAPGESRSVIETTLEPGAAQRYVLYAFAGQIMRVYLQPFGVELRIHGADGAPPAARQRYDPFWRGELPSTQDYLLELVHSPSALGPSAVPVRLSVVIVPLGQTTQPLLYQDVINGFELTYTDYFAIGQPPPIYDSSGETIPLSLTFTGTSFFQNTNLSEVSAVISTHPIDAGAACALPAFNGPAISMQAIEVNGMSYQQVHAAGIAAGNYYELISHSAANGALCFSITFYIHSTSIGAHPPGVSEFDRLGLTEHLQGVLASFRFLQG